LNASLQLDTESLRPIIRTIVEEVVAQLESNRVKLDAKLAYSEQEAARLLGVGVHVLADERRRGRIAASQIVGKRIRYTPDDLSNYLASRRTSAA
jgi:Helix-turn-helix domain